MNMRNTISIAAATLGLAITLTLSCSGGDDGGNPSSDSGTAISSSSEGGGGGSSSSGGGTGGVVHGAPVSYEGETYETVVIGTQTWMARNLNYGAPGSKCYDNSTANCNTYGKLYDWATAMGLPDCVRTSCASQITANHKGICPSGWHIPSDDDWDKLLFVADPSCQDNGYNGYYYCSGTKLKSATGWDPYDGVPVGTDEFGFAALPGGESITTGNFSSVGHYGRWWSASESEAQRAYYRNMYWQRESVNRTDNAKSGLFSVRCLKDSN
jgi:uncharacterized protein (TIGR02145 family)